MKRFLSDPAAADAQVDVHQHLWPEALVEALRSRTSGPRLDGWQLHLDGEPPCRLDPADQDLEARRAVDRSDGVDRTLLSLSGPLGVERLPADQATPLLDAWHDLGAQLEKDTDEHHAIWAATRLVEPDAGALAVTLAHPRVVGLQVPADAMATPSALEALAPLLAEAERAGLPVLVHPGPAQAPSDAAGRAALPSWWPALTSYVAQLGAAWHAWHVAGRPLLPTLRIAFVGLAGLAPLHHERLAQRGGRLGAVDPGVFYETSSYGPRAVDATTRVVGVDPLVHGSDRPNALPVDPGLGAAFAHALRTANPHHLVNGGSR